MLLEMFRLSSISSARLSMSSLVSRCWMEGVGVWKFETKNRRFACITSDLKIIEQSVRLPEFPGELADECCEL